MKKSIKLALRASEIRSDINKLDPGEDTHRKAARAARPARYGRGRNTAPRSPRRAEADATQPDAHGITPEERAFRALEHEGRAAARLPCGHGREAAERRREGAAGTPWPVRSRSAVGYDRAPPGRACRASRRCGFGRAGRLPPSAARHHRPRVRAERNDDPWRPDAAGCDGRAELSGHHHHRHRVHSREGCGGGRLGRCGNHRSRDRAGAPATLLRFPPRGSSRSLRSGGSAAE